MTWSCASRGSGPVRDVALALGSNMGDSAAILQGAIDDLAAVDGLELLDVSPVYQTDPVGGPAQDRYLNAVVVGRTSLEALTLLAVAQRVESAWHRVRGVRWGPRTLDIDILALGGEQRDDAELTLPHPRAHERAFVLVPWGDVDPGAVIAGHGTVRDLLASVDAGGVRRTDVRLHVPERA